MRRIWTGKAEIWNDAKRSVFCRVFVGILMHLLLGLVFTSVGLSQLSHALFIVFNSTTKPSSRWRRSLVQILPEEKNFVDSYDEAVRVCHENGAFLTELKSPLIFNHAYVQIEQIQNNTSKYSVN